jgi:hypothetical protein
VIAALLSTTPPTVHKSSTDDLGPPLCQVGDQESCSHLQQTTKFRGSGWSQRLSFPEQKGGPTVSLSKETLPLITCTHPSPRETRIDSARKRVIVCTSFLRADALMSISMQVHRWQLQTANLRGLRPACHQATDNLPAIVGSIRFPFSILRLF